MYKYRITSKENLIKQIKENNRDNGEINQKQLYFIKDYYIKNQINFLSYHTKIAEYDVKNKILKVTKRKYSITTTKQQNLLINNLVNFDDATIVYSDEI